MSSPAAQEREALCELAEQVGPAAPTLCEGWDVKDLVVHLVLREGHLAALGVAVPAARGWLQRVTERRGGQEFSRLVGRLRAGPPHWSVFALPGLGSTANLLEFFVHHEDVRRAQPAWQPRLLPPQTEDALWRVLRFAGRGLASRSPVPLGAERSDTGDRHRLGRGSQQVVIRGLPTEIAVFLFGRTAQARVELLGDPAAVEAVRSAPFGV